MAYWRPDGIKALSTRDGGIEFLITRNQRIRTELIEPNGCVNIVQASRIVQPPVSRVAVFKWIESGKLKATMVEGQWLITLSGLRRFANKYGKGWAPSSKYR